MVNSICDTLLQLSVLTPFVVVATRNNRNLKTGLLITAAFVFVVTSVTTDSLSNFSLFQGQQWNWIGKVVSMLIALVFIFTFKAFTPRHFGLTMKMNWANARPILFICAAYFLLRLVLYFAVTKETGTLHTETVLFQATLPGLAEELVFRGILLTLLNHVFVKPKLTFAKVSFGWGAILTSILFGLTHGFFLDDSYHVQFNAFSTARTAFDGFLFALLVEKTKSIVPSILFHNLLNLIGNH